MDQRSRIVAGGIVMTSYAGHRAKQAGAAAESPVDISLTVYQNRGLAIGEATYPPFIKTRRGWVPKGKAAPDRRVTLPPGGRTLWLEVKTWKAKEQHAYALQKRVKGLIEFIETRFNQFYKLQQESEFGALAFYLVCWRWRGRSDWRLHHINDLEIVDNHHIPFERSAGLPVTESPDGFPDWLPVVLSFAQRMAGE